MLRPCCPAWRQRRCSCGLGPGALSEPALQPGGTGDRRGRLGHGGFEAVLWRLNLLISVNICTAASRPCCVGARTLRARPPCEGVGSGCCLRGMRRRPRQRSLMPCGKIFLELEMFRLAPVVSFGSDFCRFSSVLLWNGFTPMEVQQSYLPAPGARLWIMQSARTRQLELWGGNLLLSDLFGNCIFWSRNALPHPS